MLTREEFVQKAIEISTAKYPAVAALVKASDPRILQQIEAMATMLAMYSSQLEVAQSEPFEKTRDSTVLADAAMRGIVPKSTPSCVSISATNSSTSKSVLNRAAPSWMHLADFIDRRYPWILALEKRRS